MNTTSYTTATIPDPGQLVLVRQRHFVVLDVQKSALPVDPLYPNQRPPQHVVRLSSVEDDALGEELEVIWEIEIGAQVYEKAELPKFGGFDAPERFEAFVDAVRWGAISSADAKALQSPFRSGITIEEYQLDPVVRALRMPRINLLIADDVGLGKTIETGLVIQELLLRHRAQSVLIVCPSAIQIQWQEQMRDKFGIEFRIVDSELMKHLRRRRGLHVNPWTHFPHLITSIDFLKRERPLRLLRETLPAKGESAYPRRYDLLIVDEAHNVSPSGRGHYATDSLRTLAIRALAPHFEHKLFLTATPHNGYAESFTALLELLDNQRFARGVRPDRAQLENVMVRRLKSELKRRWDGSQRFAERKVAALEVDYSEGERQAHQLLRKYAALRQQGIANETERVATEFVLKILKKRLFSSPAAFATTLAKHQQTMRTRNRAAMPPSSMQFLCRQIEAIEEEYADDGQYEETTEDVLQHSSRVWHELSREETQVLQALTQFADEASSRVDSKAQTLIAWLQAQIKPNGQWNRERVLIFTEYRTTQKWLHGLLAAAGFAQGERLMILYGGMPSDERERIKAAFQASPDVSPVRILLATDAASEGLDLQNHCSRLIHYEIPWNPMRMEQRNGRLDRHGQRASEVWIAHFVSKGFRSSLTTALTLESAAKGELEGDLEFLMRAVEKTETIREDLGKVGPVIAAQVEEAMLGRRRTLDTRQAEQDADAIRKMIKFERQLREQLAKLYEQLRETKRDLGISPESIQRVVTIALQLAGQPPLRPAEAPGIWPDPAHPHRACPVFHLPALTGSWARCAEGLAHPHTGQIRPIVFDHALAQGRDDVVLAHLNHRMIQMCLRLLRAEIWSQGSHRNLHRIAALQVSDDALSEPAIIAHGRIVVLGGDNQRLHEEIIMVGGVLKQGRFVRLTIEQTQAAYAARTRDESPEFHKERLIAAQNLYAEPLLKALEQRMVERTKNLQKHLDERTAKEIADMTMILEELARSITAELAEPLQHASQLEFWTATEREQFEANLSSLQRRLAEIPEEIEREAEAIRARYRHPVPRLFPVAITFLIPKGLR